MPSRKKQNASALKHGAYSAVAVLPTESEAEFEKLHEQLRSEFLPSGALEEEIIRKIACNVWREKNLSIIARAENAREKIRLAEEMDKRNPERLVAALQRAIDDPQSEEANNVRRVVQSMWAQTIGELGDTYALVDLKEASFEGLEKELAIRERLDSALTRLLKQLLMVRGVKSITAGTSMSSPIPRRSLTVVR